MLLHRTLTFRALLVVTFFASATGLAEDWSEFRGPTGQGHYRGDDLPVTWDAKKNVVWATAIPGKGWSSPVVAAGRVFLTTAVEKTSTGKGNSPQSLRFIALDAASGKIEHDREVFEQAGTRIHGKNSHASPTPLYDPAHDLDGKEPRVYVHFGTQGTAAIAASSGETLWSTRELKYKPVHGSGGSPVIAGNLLVLNCDGGDKQFVVALDRRTGKERWRTERAFNPGRGFSFCTPLVIDVDQQQQIVSPGSGGVVAYTLTGNEIWRVDYPGGYSVVPRPVFAHGLVFVCSGYDQPRMFAIDPSGKGNTTRTHVKWQTKSNVPHNPSLVVVGDELYAVNDKGILSCLDAKTGERRWRERLGGAFSSSLLAAGDTIYAQSEDGETIVFKADRQGYRPVARSALEERCLASLGAAGGRLYLRTQPKESEGLLRCLHVGDKKGD